MSKKVKIFAADVDGTLIRKGQNLMPKTREALIRLHEEGVLIGPASGRPLDHTIIDKWKEWDLGFEFDFAIGMNGGDLWVKGSEEIRHYHQIQPEDIKQILGFIWDMDINVIMYENAYAHVKGKRMDTFLENSRKRNHSYVEIVEKENMWQHATGKIETQMKPEIEPAMWEAVRKNQRDSWLCIRTYKDDDHATIEFMDPRLHKGVALEQFAKSKGIDLEDVIAFGDQDNDIGMLKTAGWSVCLLNGSDEAKAVSTAVTEYTVAEDGVGRYLFDHYFDQE